MLRLRHRAASRNWNAQSPYRDAVVGSSGKSIANGWGLRNRPRPWRNFGGGKLESSRLDQLPPAERGRELAKGQSLDAGLSSGSVRGGSGAPGGGLRHARSGGNRRRRVDVACRRIHGKTVRPALDLDEVNNLVILHHGDGAGVHVADVKRPVR